MGEGGLSLRGGRCLGSEGEVDSGFERGDDLGDGARAGNGREHGI